jgi:hypothetical protein
LSRKERKLFDAVSFRQLAILSTTLSHLTSSRRLFIGGGQKIGKQFAQILVKVAQTVAKISSSKLNLKVQNIYIKPLLKLKNTCKNKPYFKTAYVGENEKKMLK